MDRIERQVIDPMTCQALRTICVAYKDFDPRLVTDWEGSRPNVTSGFSPARRVSATSLTVPKEPPSAVSQQRTFYKMEVELNCLGIAGMR